MKMRILLSIFLVTIVCKSYAQQTVNVTFSVDMSLLAAAGKFNAGTDMVYLRGSFNNWNLETRVPVSTGNVYSVTVPLNENGRYEYKYYISSAGAENSGWEKDFPVSSNRVITLSTNNLVLATVYYNDGDMSLVKETEHFRVIYSAQENTLIDKFCGRLEVLHNIVSSSLNVIPAIKTQIYLYKNLQQLHLAQGYPENSDNSIGSAYGKSLLVMLSPAAMGLNEALGLMSHEYTHCLEAWKTKVTLPAWLNEGIACYFGRNFSTKDYIKSVMDTQGKPDIAAVFNGNMGYAYSSIVAYYLMKTKGMSPVADFIENMDYSKIGYSGLPALQTDWHAFLDTYLDYTATVNVTFRVEMADMIAAGYFNPSKDKVYVKGDWNSWDGQQMTLESGSVYSLTIPIKRYWFYEYKFFINSAGAPENGWEFNTAETASGNRQLDLENTAKTLPTVRFASDALPAIPGVDMTRFSAKIKALRFHGRIYGSPAFSTFNYPVKILSTVDYQTKKTADNFEFDAGFVGTNDTIYISAPTTSAQQAVFSNLTDVALYYLCQSYMYHYYQTRNLPLIFKVGFPQFEAGLLPADTEIKTAINNYGHPLPSFDVLNNPSTFIANKGIFVAGVFGEFMSVFKNWGYPMITNINASGFNVASYWFNVDNLQGLLGDFNRYLYARFLQPDENLRVRMYQETAHFKFYTRPVDAILNFPLFPNVCETAYNEYVTNFGASHGEKLSFFTLPECIDAEVEGASCGGRVTGGTAWSSGVHSTCAATADQVQYFEGMCRHELAHAFQAIFPQGTVTAWLNEGFPSFCSDGMITNLDLNIPARGISMRQAGIQAMNAALEYFGHRPTYEETRIYPSPDYGYYTLGYLFIDYQYRIGGYKLLKEIQMNDIAACLSLGYTSAQAFLEDFYFDFDIRVLQKPIVTLLNPVANVDETNSTVNISWTPLKNDVKLDVSVSTNDGASWTEVASRTTATNCSWYAGDIQTRFYVKISAPDNLNIATTFGPFTKGDLNKLNILSPMVNNYIITNDTTPIKWGKTNIQNIKIEYSLSNGASWTTISSINPASTGIYKWIVPSSLSGNCQVRISDVANSPVSSTSETFKIVANNNVGGPYVLDNNTIALFHFDNDLNNRSAATPNATGNVQNLTDENSVTSDSGRSYKTNSILTVPHHANLNLSGDWTIEAWVKLTSYNVNSNMYLLWKPGDSNSYESNFSLEVNPWWGNVFYGYYFSGLNSRIGITGPSVELNKWYHVSFTRDTKKKLIQVIVHDANRQLISLTDMLYNPTETYLNSQNLQIGTGLDGYIDEVRISNVVRSFINTGIDDTEGDNTFSVYPNPASAVVYLRQLPATGTLRLLNAQGQTLLMRNLHGNDKEMIDLSGFSEGIYFVQLTEKKRIQTQKIVVL